MTIHGVAGPVEGHRVFQIERFEPAERPPAHDPHDVHGLEGHPEEVMAEYEHHPGDLLGAAADPGYEEADIGRPHPSEVLDEDWGLDDEDAGGEEYDYGEGYEPLEGDDGYEDQGYGDQGYEGPGHVEGEGYGDAASEDNLGEMEPLLGDMPVPVVVELGRVQLSADEVICLRAGQILELGRSPTDPVDLVVSGRLLAKGELVEIEGQLGVRILSLAKEPSS
jgi:type III secretion system YscQ/HrcQ family protein